MRETFMKRDLKGYRDLRKAKVKMRKIKRRGLKQKMNKLEWIFMLS